MAVGLGRRDVLTVLGVSACGLAWVAQLFLPWAGVGALSTSSGADVWRLSQDGLLPDDLARVVPALVVLPALGVGALALAGVSGPRPRLVRLGFVSLGLAVGLVLVAGFGSQVQGRGAGMLLTAAATVLAAVLATLEILRLRRPAAAEPRTEVE
jgi:hypothetical protein